MEYTREHSGLNSWYKKLQYHFKQLFLKKQKTYILPTKFGLAYGSLCFVLLLMGMVYANNLVYIVCFYLTTMAMAIAKMTNDHVGKVSIENAYLKETYAENEQILFVTIRNTSKQNLSQIKVRISKQDYFVKTDLKSDEIKTLELRWNPQKRGVQQLPRIRIQSSYPSHIFEAWKIFKSEEDFIIYPARRGNPQYPESSFATQDSVGVLKEIRDYHAGDSPKRIHWRSLAKVGQLRTLVHEGNEGQTCYLDLQQVQHLSTESRLEQLTLWISKAEAQGTTWQLKLNNSVYNSQDTNATKLALTALATWTEP